MNKTKSNRILEYQLVHLIKLLILNPESLNSDFFLTKFAVYLYVPAFILESKYLEKIAVSGLGV